MNKADLIKRMSAEAGITQSQAGKAFNSLIEGISGSLARGERVTIVDFGTFSVVDRKARTGRNPKTGAPLEIPARRVPKFSPGKSLRSKVK